MLDEHYDFIEKDRIKAIEWARSILATRDEYYILDTETTGLDNPEIVELAILDLDGNVIVNQRFNPVGAIEAGASAIHHITPDIATRYPRWDVIADRLAEIVGERKLLIYNKSFDCNALNVTYIRSGRVCPAIDLGDCVMQWYSQFCGNWNGYHNSYTWQRLPGGDHSALGDCIATLDVIKEMAA